MPPIFCLGSVLTYFRRVVLEMDFGNYGGFKFIYFSALVLLSHYLDTFETRMANLSGPKNTDGFRGFMFSSSSIYLYCIVYLTNMPISSSFCGCGVLLGDILKGEIFLSLSLLFIFTWLDRTSEA